MPSEGFKKEAAALVRMVLEWEEHERMWPTPEALLAEVLQLLYEDSFRAGWAGAEEALLGEDE